MVKKRLKRQVPVLIALLFIIAGATAQTITWTSTTAQNPWVDKGTIPVTPWDNDQTLYITVDEATKYQQIDGWGGALNEYGWIAMALLPAAERDKVLKALFDTSGCAFNIGRIGIGANDYSQTFYSCSETPNDFTMSNFSLAKEKSTVIPFALAAKTINPAIKFWGAPHSPPAWMKQNNSMLDGSLKTDDATRKAYALYFQKWVQGMAAEQIPIYAVHIQNEPNITGTGYPTCFMSGAEMGTLIKDYIGPQFKTAGLSTEIWVGTLHSAGTDMKSFYPEYIPPTLGDPATSAFITGVGMQWNSLAYAAEVPKNYPTKKTMQTETQCGNYYWMAGYNSAAAPNDWAYGVFTLHQMLQWLRAGVNSYCQWNMVLDEKGKSNSTVVQWPQNSMISVTRSTGAVRYNPQFYAVKHFSHYVKPGAVRIATAGNYSTGGSNPLSENIAENLTDGDMMAFLNPDGQKVLVVRNSTGSEKSVGIRIGTDKCKPTLPPNSLNTFVITNSVAVKKGTVTPEMRMEAARTPAGMRFAIPVPATVHQLSLSIVDMSGRVVKEFRVAPPTSRVSIEWNGKNERGEPAAHGAYLARVTSDNRLVLSAIKLVMQ